MKFTKKSIALCALLTASLPHFAHAIPFTPNGDFSSGTPSAGPLELDDPGVITDWAPDQSNDGGEIFRYEYRADAGPAGVGDNCAVIQDFGGLGYGTLISNNDDVTTLASLGLSVGNVYQFSHDMKYDTSNGGGATLGGFKVDFFNGDAFVNSTGDVFPDAIGTGATWETYTYDIAIPSGVDGIKVALVWSPGADVLFDNVSYDSTPLTAYAPSAIPNGDFEIAAGDSWVEDFDLGAFAFSYPAAGGSPSGTGGYGVIDDTDGAGFGVLIANDDNIMTLNGLSLPAGESYKFSVDMQILTGVNIGALKVEFFDGLGSIADTGDLFPTIIGSGATWETYDFDVAIPSNATAIKVVAVNGEASSVGFDNFTFDPTPLVLPPVTQVKNKNFDDLGTDWLTDSNEGDTGGASFAFDFPSTGGSTGGGGANPGGHAVIEDLNSDGFAVLVSDNGQITPIAELGGGGLTPGEAYVFSMDMKLISGTDIGGIKVEFYNGTVGAGSTGDLRVDPIAPAGDWQTYDYNISIPSGVDGIKVVPLWGPGSEVGYDNICIDDTPITLPTVTLLNPDFEEPDGDGWDPQFVSGVTTTFPASGGNPGGYARMDFSGAGWGGVIVSNDNAIIPVADLGIIPGTTITVNMDMLKETGTNMGTLKLEYFSGASGGTNNGGNDDEPTPPTELVADGSWATYTFTYDIPTNVNGAAGGGAVDGIKVVPVNTSSGSTICYDNIEIVLPVVESDLILSVDSFDTDTNMIMFNLTGIETGETYSIFSSSTLSSGVTTDTTVDVTDATPQPFAVSADEASSPRFFQAKKD